MTFIKDVSYSSISCGDFVISLQCILRKPWRITSILASIHIHAHIYRLAGTTTIRDTATSNVISRDCGFTYERIIFQFCIKFHHIHL